MITLMFATLCVAIRPFISFRQANRTSLPVTAGLAPGADMNGWYALEEISVPTLARGLCSEGGALALLLDCHGRPRRQPSGVRRSIR